MGKIFGREKTENDRSQRKYLIKIKGDSIVDLSGNSISDSSKIYSFETINIDTLSSISGNFFDEDTTAIGAIYLKASQQGRNPLSYEIQIQQPGKYEFKDILPGVYSIEGFRDGNTDGKYNFGQAIPFQAAERFFVYPDSIKVRARWPNEGNDLILK